MTGALVAPLRRGDNPTLIGFATAGYTSTGNRSSNPDGKTIATEELVLGANARSRAYAVAIVLDSYVRAAGARPKLLS